MSWSQALPYLPWLCIPMMAFLNHVRGQWGDIVPLFAARFWVLPGVFLAGWIVLPWTWAAYWMLAWLFSQWLGWGRWYDLGHWPLPARDPSWFEVQVERVPGNDAVHFTMRTTLCCLPMWWLSPWLLLLGIGQTACYAIGWAVAKKGPIAVGEWLTGAMQGAALVVLSFGWVAP
jgi:hypothetical protein